MRIFKSHPLLKLANSYVIDSPQPSNLSYLWNFGSLLAFCLVIQIVTGVTLAMHYNPSVLEAFNSVEHIMRDVNNGWLVRYLHSNTASAFFFLVYLHIGRNLYYASYKAPRTLTFVIGVVILIAMMATAFLGYVLPYGQMSLWGILNCLKCIIFVVIVLSNVIFLYEHNLYFFNILIFLFILLILFCQIEPDLLDGGDRGNLIKGVVDVNNINNNNLSGLEDAVKHLGTVVVYSTGITVGAGLLKGSGLPLGAKIGGTIGIGIASLVGFNIAQKAFALNNKSGNINIETDNPKYSVNTPKDNNISKDKNLPNDNSFPNSSALEDSDIVNMNDVLEILNLNLILQYIIIYLFIITFIFIIFKWLYNKNYKFNFIKSISYGERIQIFIKHMLVLSNKTNSIFINILLLTIFISNIVCTYSLSVVLSKFV